MCSCSSFISIGMTNLELRILAHHWLGDHCFENWLTTFEHWMGQQNTCPHSLCWLIIQQKHKISVDHLNLTPSFESNSFLTLLLCQLLCQTMFPFCHFILIGWHLCPCGSKGALTNEEQSLQHNLQPLISKWGDGTHHFWLHCLCTGSPSHTNKKFQQITWRKHTKLVVA